MTNTPIPASLDGAYRPFTREDLKKKENRVNVELFGAHSIPEFWKPLCKLLEIPASAWLTRDVVAGTGDRPDFILNGLGTAKGCVEVELDEQPNEPQLECYRKHYSKVICVVGKRGRRQHPNLEDVADLARSVAKELHPTNPPAMAVLNHLAEAIKDALNEFKRHASVQATPAYLRDERWFLIAAGPLLRLHEAGYVQNRTTSGVSLSLQLERVPCLHGKRLALLTQRNRAVVQIPRTREMERVFDGAFEEVTMAWDETLNHVKPHWQSHVDGNERICIETKDFEREAERFAKVFSLLADLILGTEPV